MTRQHCYLILSPVIVAYLLLSFFYLQPNTFAFRNVCETMGRCKSTVRWVSVDLPVLLVNLIFSYLLLSARLLSRIISSLLLLSFLINIIQSNTFAFRNVLLVVGRCWSTVILVSVDLPSLLSFLISCYLVLSSITFIYLLLSFLIYNLIPLHLGMFEKWLGRCRSNLRWVSVDLPSLLSFLILCYLFLSPVI